MTEARVIDGKRMAAEIREEVRREAAQFFDTTGIRPRIVFILVGNNPASEVYVRNKGIAAEEAGFAHETKSVPVETEESALLDMILAVNEDPATHGLLVQFPLPQQIREERVIELLAPEKDVDGFHPRNVGRLAIGMGNYFAPCTPLGVMEMLSRERVPVAGRHVVIVGRSNLVGKPLALLLSQKSPKANAVVTLAHSAAGAKLGDLTREADILIAAMGVPRAITADMVREGTVVIDVGINRIEDNTRASGSRLVGDVDYDAVRHKASLLTPVPGGVGPMTIAMLLRNTLTAAQRQTLKRQ